LAFQIAVTFPGVAPVAIQQGRYAAQAVRARLKDGATVPLPRQNGNVISIGH
jgi:NADH dehydrogenase FAD-containing subunit